jgi:hypothetical protein
MAKPTADQILSDPGAYTVDEVTAALADATPEQTQETKALEAAGKQRVGILDYQPPVPEPEQPKYARARILDPSEGPLIVGHIDALGRTATHPDIVGALDGNDSELFTGDEVRAAIGEFLTRPLQEA